MQGHILKFLDRQQPSARVTKRFRPQETFGHSKQSPDWFNRKFSLKAHGGYQYKYDDPKFRQKFTYNSQKHQLKIHNQHQKNFNAQIIGKNTFHNRKKGLLSQYLDKNSWMKQTIPITGFQRDQQSRRLNNQDRDKNIQTIRMKKSTYIASKTSSNFYSSKMSKMQSSIKSRQIKTSHENSIRRQNGNSEINPQLQMKFIPSQKSIPASQHSRSKSITLLMGQKEQIRTERNKIAFDKIHKFQKMKLEDTLTTKKLRTIDSQFVQARMTQTAREWVTGSKLSPYKSIEMFDKIIDKHASINTQMKSMNRGLFAKKLSVPLNNDFTYEFEDKKIISNQI